MEDHRWNPRAARTPRRGRWFFTSIARPLHPPFSAERKVRVVFIVFDVHLRDAALASCMTHVERALAVRDALFGERHQGRSSRSIVPVLRIDHRRVFRRVAEDVYALIERIEVDAVGRASARVDLLDAV